MNQTQIKQYFVASADARDTRTKQIARLHDEGLHSYKLRFFRYKVGNIPEPGERRTFWYFMKLTLPSSHPLNVVTFNKIIRRRGLSLTNLRLLNLKLYETCQETDFNSMSMVDVLHYIFSEEELRFADAQVLAA